MVVLSCVAVVAVLVGIALLSVESDREVELGKHNIDTGPVTDESAVRTHIEIRAVPTIETGEFPGSGVTAERSAGTQTRFDTFGALLASRDYELAVGAGCRS